MLSLFSGAGMIDLAASWAGIETVAFCEIEEYPTKILQRRFPGVPIYRDVRELTAEKLKTDGISKIDIISGGFPCQDVSTAAKRIFPDADDSFLQRNYNDINFIADVDRKCAECINTGDCPYSGHQPFLRVDKESGFTYVVADRERCYKYHPLVPEVTPKQSTRRQGDLTKV
ncbi:DNA cytosine methyltransferase [Phascolarctobacterium faecium]|uniref:DNA cytosine methyltransferase n=1 Tax=Phascolarctobacterium faecium TaxID=33025 RepID=UPI003AB54A8F